MLIVVEGCDRTGKTTLAERLRTRLGSRARVLHAGVPQCHPVEEYETALDGYVPGSGDHLILDRWHVGEHVWPEVFGRATLLDLAVSRHVELFMRSRGALVVLADRCDTAEHERALAEGNEPLGPGQLAEARFRFREALDWTACRYLVYDHASARAADLDYMLIRAVAQEREVERVWALAGPEWVGDPWPLLILVGDELGPERSGHRSPIGVPFVPYAATSGHYLMHALSSGWPRTLVVNAHVGRTGEPRDLAELVRQLGAPPVVALGKRAAAALRAQAVPHGAVPHPQYWRRFHHHQPLEYETLIEIAAEDCRRDENTACATEVTCST